MSINRTLNRTAVMAVALAVLALASPVTAGSIAHPITVNTSSSYFTGVTGSLDFQFNPGDATSQVATATITNFMTDGLLGTVIPSTPPITGGGASSSPARDSDHCQQATLSPDSNELNQTFTYGSYFSFTRHLLRGRGRQPDQPGFGQHLQPVSAGRQRHDPAAEPSQQPPRRSAGYHRQPMDGTTTVFTIPEPSALTLLGLGLAGVWGCRAHSQAASGPGECEPATAAADGRPSQRACSRPGRRVARRTPLRIGGYDDQMQNHVSNGLVCHQRGLLDEAGVRLYGRRPPCRGAEDPDALHLLGVVALQQGRPQQAADLIGRVPSRRACQRGRLPRQSSVVSHSDSTLSRAFLARATLARITSAVAVQTNGFAWLLLCAT